MIGSTRDDVMNLKSPAAVGGATQGIYVHVDDVNAHHDRAKAAGAEIIMELEDTEYGSREYIARDLEGHVWSFGTYGPEIDGDDQGRVEPGQCLALLELHPRPEHVGHERNVRGVLRVVSDTRQGHPA